MAWTAEISSDGYVLEDATGIHSPDEQAKIAVILYHKWKADRIIGETNNYGDMIEVVIRHQDANVAYHKRHGQPANTHAQIGRGAL